MYFSPILTSAGLSIFEHGDSHSKIYAKCFQVQRLVATSVLRTLYLSILSSDVGGVPLLAFVLHCLTAKDFWRLDSGSKSRTDAQWT